MADTRDGGRSRGDKGDGAESGDGISSGPPTEAAPTSSPPFLAEFIGWILVGAAFCGPALWGLHALSGEPLAFREAMVQGLGFGVVMGLVGRPLTRLIDRGIRVLRGRGG